MGTLFSISEPQFPNFWNGESHTYLTAGIPWDNVCEALSLMLSRLHRKDNVHHHHDQRLSNFPTPNPHRSISKFCSISKIYFQVSSLHFHHHHLKLGHSQPLLGTVHSHKPVSPLHFFFSSLQLFSDWGIFSNLKLSDALQWLPLKWIPNILPRPTQSHVMGSLLSLWSGLPGFPRTLDISHMLLRLLLHSSCVSLKDDSEKAAQII